MMMNSSANTISGTSGIANPKNLLVQSLTTGGDGGTAISFRSGDVTSPREVAVVFGNGNFFAANNITAGGLCCGSSDSRLKCNVEEVASPLAIVLGLRPVRFDWRPDIASRRSTARQIGFLAQEVRPLVPEVVTENDDGMLAMDYGRLAPLLAGAAQELHAMLDDECRRNDAQRALIADQQTEIQDLKSRLAAMERAIAGLIKQQQ